MAKEKKERKTITFSMEKEAYKVAKKVYDKKITINEGVNELQRKCWNKDANESLWNENAAKDYIVDFRCLVNGNRPQRGIRICRHFMYYLSQIFGDDKKDGKNIYDNALSALKKHNEHVFGVEEDKNNQTHILLYNELIKNNLLIEEICQHYKEKGEWFKDEDLILYINNQKNSIAPTKKQNPIIIISKNKISLDSKCTANNNFESYKDRVINIRKKIKHINKDWKNNKKETIFKMVDEWDDLWDNIGTFCKSDGDFIKFINSLYMLFFETTKDKDPYGTLDKKGYPKYIKKLPEQFTRPGTETYHFMDIIGILRHVLGKAHIESILDTPPWKTKYTDALKELMSSKSDPRATKDFQKLQYKVLDKFENAINILDQIVQKTLNPPNNH